MLLLLRCLGGAFMDMDVSSGESLFTSRTPHMGLVAEMLGFKPINNSSGMCKQADRLLCKHYYLEERTNGQITPFDM